MRDRRCTWAWLFGAVCPERGVGAAVVLPHVDVEAMNIHQAKIGRRVAEGAHAVLVLDGAGWHTSPRLCVPDNASLLPLPRYAPELNPVENVWEYLRQNWRGHRVWNSYDAIVQACCDAWNMLMRMPEQIASIATRAWAQVKLVGDWYQEICARVRKTTSYCGQGRPFGTTSCAWSDPRTGLISPCAARCAGRWRGRA